jgi:hypothetical protein
VVVVDPPAQPPVVSAEDGVIPVGGVLATPAGARSPLFPAARCRRGVPATPGGAKSPPRPPHCRPVASSGEPAVDTDEEHARHEHHVNPGCWSGPLHAVG